MEEQIERNAVKVRIEAGIQIRWRSDGIPSAFDSSCATPCFTTILRQKWRNRQFIHVTFSSQCDRHYCCNASRNLPSRSDHFISSEIISESTFGSKKNPKFPGHSCCFIDLDSPGRDHLFCVGSFFASGCLPGIPGKLEWFSEGVAMDSVKEYAKHIRQDGRPTQG
jgi:hypothetical protein